MDNVFIEFVVRFMLGIGCSAIINIAMTLVFLLHFVTIDKQTNSNDICFAQKSYATDINRNKDSTIFSLMYFFGILFAHSFL